MSKYLMTLRPLDTFFFGQENKYRKREEKNRKELNVVADYFQESAYFPQQTTLLGMLRYYLLVVNGQLPIKNKQVADDLIGDKSFRVSDDPLDFKHIKSMSPVFISHLGRAYWPQPLDIRLKEKRVLYFDKEEKAISKTNLPKHNGQITYFPDYKEKDGLDHFLLDMDDYQKFLPYKFDKDEKSNGIFVPEERTGITKGEGGETQDAAFYKQVVYRLKDDAAFQCIVDLDDPKISHGHEGFVPMGAEKSMFRIKFTETDQSLADKIKLENRNAPKLVLLSDAYLPDGFEQHYHFSISETKPFRFLQTETHADKWKDSLHFRGNHHREMVRSIRFNLFQRGSVFYFKNEEDLGEMVKQLKGQVNFFNIGYNHFKEIK